MPMRMSMNQNEMLLLIGIVLLLALVYILARLRRRTAALPPPATAATITPAPASGTEPGAESAPDAAEAGASPFLAAPDGPEDDLGRIKGIGPKLSALLHDLGVYHYRQIAGWTPEQLAIVDSRLDRFQGRPERDQWQSQARLLAAGDIKAYERAHGKLNPDDPAGRPGA